MKQTGTCLTFVEVVAPRFQSDGRQRFIRSPVVGTPDNVHPAEWRKGSALLEEDPALVHDVTNGFAGQIYLK